MTEDYPTVVQVGDVECKITRFRGLKAALAGALVSKVMKQIPEIQDEVLAFRKDFRAKNTIRITAAMAKLPRFAPLGLGPEDFEAAGGVIEFPEEPDVQSLFVHMFPVMFELADKELRRFFGLIAISNAELERADDADDVDNALYSLGTQLVRRGEIDELLELVVVGYEVLQDQIMRKKDRLGKLKELPFLRGLLSTQETPDQSEQTQTTQESTPSSSSAPSSSTTLPADSDGIEEPLSTVYPGENFND